MKRALTMVAASVFLLSATLVAGDVDLKEVKCVMNPKADAKEATATDYKGGQVFFCCEKCQGKFNEAPEKHASAANAQLVATKQAKQEKCPITGKPVNEEHMVKVAGVEVGFCCPNCKGKVAKAEGKEQIDLVFADKAFAKGFKVPEKK